MSEKLTWTHVDKHVRWEHEKRGMLAMGMSDAEITLSYITWLERMLLSFEKSNHGLQTKLEVAETKLRVVQQPLKKTKQRLADLENAPDELRQHVGFPA